MNVITKTIDLGDGRQIEIETGKLAKQADGSVVVKMGATMLLATVVSAKESKPDVDFMPLSVEYQEKFAAVGRIPGGFMKREGRPSEQEILTSRLVDRALRPLFPDDYHAETFVTISMISADTDIMPDALAGLAASAALAVSDVPFNGPISEVRVARIDGQFVINPNASALAKADIDMMVGATADNILMVEGEMNEISEQEMIQALEVAHQEIKKHCAIQLEMREAVGATTREYVGDPQDEALEKQINDFCYDKVFATAKQGLSKHERSEAFSAIKDEFMATLNEDEQAEKESLIHRYFHDTVKKALRNLLLNEKLRIDGRSPETIRPIWSEVDYLPAAHGSAIFTRGETQSLTTLTLGSKMDEKMIDNPLQKSYERFVLHYNFPPFSTGDARPVRGVSRREIGHGNLAHRALKRMIPSEQEAPYAIRLVSDILESNGSSSMATVCAGTLAMMDAGLQIKKPVSGIAMGLITDPDGRYVVLSDILGDEDHLGDMDFKVTGTKDGITACQMDIKVDGLSFEVLEKALLQAKDGRLHILNKMMETLSEPRQKYKDHTPQIQMVYIKTDEIGGLIGPGGKIIQGIQAETHTTITITEEDNRGAVAVLATSPKDMEAAMHMIKMTLGHFDIGEIFHGKVKTITDFGAFIEIVPGKDGLLHISEINHDRVKNVRDVLTEGDMIDVKLIGLDPRNGKLKLSRKALLPKDE